MPRTRKAERRILGPTYNRPGRWKVITIGGPGPEDRAAAFYSTKEQAQRAVDLCKAELEAEGRVSVEEAIKSYDLHLRRKGNKERSVIETIRRMRRFFTEPDLPIHVLESKYCKWLYQTMVETVIRPATDTTPAKTMAPDSHRNYLAEARSFLAWTVKQRWLPSNPLDGVEGVGKRRHGKRQLRIDEARLWLTQAMALAVAGDEGSIAAMMTLLMGLRASEIITRTPRDVDDEARLLWIDDSSTQDGKDWTPKTEKGRRTIEIPDPLRPHLAKLAEDRKGKPRLFWITDGEHWRDWPAEQVRRICRLAKVPVVSAQSMRGLHSTLAVEAGATGHLVASTLGHESFSTTKESYARSDAVGRAERKRAMDVIQGGLR